MKNFHLVKIFAKLPAHTCPNVTGLLPLVKRLLVVGKSLVNKARSLLTRYAFGKKFCMDFCDKTICLVFVFGKSKFCPVQVIVFASYQEGRKRRCFYQ